MADPQPTGPVQAPGASSAPQQQPSPESFFEEITELDKLVDQHKHEIIQLGILRRTKQEAYDRLVSQERDIELEPSPMQIQSEIVEDILNTMSQFECETYKVVKHINQVCGRQEIPEWPVPNSSCISNISALDSQSQIKEMFAMLAAFNSKIAFIGENVIRIWGKPDPQCTSYITALGGESQIDDIFGMLSAFISTFSSIREIIKREPQKSNNIQLPIPESLCDNNTISQDIKLENMSQVEPQVESLPSCGPAGSQRSLAEGQVIDIAARFQ